MNYMQKAEKENMPRYLPQKNVPFTERTVPQNETTSILLWILQRCNDKQTKLYIMCPR